ncbi:MAG TPA: M23 family metallopeptidase [Cellulomonas sp.]
MAGHRGVDLAAAPGSTVLAPRSGTVTFAGTVVDRPVVTIQHDDGLRTSLEPVHAGVDVGSRVVAGAPVGTLSTGGHATSTGRDATESCAPESCVHWGVRRGEDYLDPMALLHPGPVVLLSSARVDGSRPGAHPRHDVLTGTTDPGRARRVSRGPPR